MNRTRAYGRWLIDEVGRVVQLHGLRIRYASSKMTENSADTRHIFRTGDDNTDMTQEEIDILVREGFNAIRYNFDWATLEPEPGKLNEKMYRRVADTVALFKKNGVRALVGMSHDMYSANYAEGRGYGAPAWACINQNYPERIEENRKAREEIAKLMSGGSQSAGSIAKIFSMIDNRHVQEAFENFYHDTPAADGIGILTHYINVVRYLAEVIKNEENVYALDMLHEPYSEIRCRYGYKTLSPMAYENYFKSTVLPNALRKLIEAVREVNQMQTLFFQPPIIIDNLSEGNLTKNAPMRFTDDDNIGFSIHPVSFGITPEEEKENMVKTVSSIVGYCEENGFAAASTGCALPSFYSNSVYFETCTEMFVPVHTAGFVKEEMPELLDALVIPYAQLTTGTPEFYHFDRETNVMEYRYRAKSVTGAPIAKGACTEIFIPARKYPEGYAADVKGAKVVSEQGAPWLVLENEENAEEIYVKLYPIKGGRTEQPMVAIGPTANVK